MTTLYKIVRKNWTDCYSGKVKYAVGETVTVDNPDDPRVLCGKGLHACHKPEDCLEYRNRNWPVRLLEVETDTIIAQDKTKVRAKSLTVKAELPLSRCFGPNGEAVLQFLEEVKQVKWFKPRANCRDEIVSLMQEHFARLKPYGLKKLYPVRFVDNWAAAAGCAAGAAARYDDDDAAWAAARYDAWYAADDAAGCAARYAAGCAARDAAGCAADDAAWYADDDAADDAVDDAAWCAAWDAAWLTVADLIPNPNPFEPLFEVYDLGGWPIGIVDGEFVVFLPKEVRQ